MRPQSRLPREGHTQKCVPFPGLRFWSLQRRGSCRPLDGREVHWPAWPRANPQFLVKLETTLQSTKGAQVNHSQWPGIQAYRGSMSISVNRRPGMYNVCVKRSMALTRLQHQEILGVQDSGALRQMSRGIWGSEV